MKESSFLVSVPPSGKEATTEGETLLILRRS